MAKQIKQKEVVNGVKVEVVYEQISVNELSREDRIKEILAKYGIKNQYITDATSELIDNEDVLA